MAMPAQFGTVFRSFVRKNPTNNLGVELFVVTRNSNLKLTLPATVIKNNIEVYLKQFKSFSDNIKITNGRIINIGVDFTIAPAEGVNDSEAMMEVILLIQRMLDTARTNFNDSIVISEMQARIQSLAKIRSVPLLKITNKYGTISGRDYSGTQFNIEANSSAGILKFPEDTVWELKYPNFDIIGRPTENRGGGAGGGGGAGY
jgi:hypothetical protein